jgi:hypothetical protein
MKSWLGKRLHKWKGKYRKKMRRSFVQKTFDSPYKSGNVKGGGAKGIGERRE